MKPTTPPVNIPSRSDSSILAKYLRPGEAVVIAKFVGVGNSAPYDFRAKDNRSYVFRWETKQQGHTLRVPLNLWMQNGAKMAHDMLDERRLPHPMVITFETPETAVQPDISLEMGATDTVSSAENVVGLGVPESTVAPAVETAEQVEERLAGQNDSLIEEENAENEQISAAASDQADKAALYDLAYDLVEAPKRIKELAAIIGVPEAGLREAIALPASRVELAAAGWVRRKGGNES